MAIKSMPLSRLKADLEQTLNECAASGETVVVEMPDHRLLAIQPLEPQEDDSLTEELLASNPKFQALAAKSKASPRKFFSPGQRPATNGSSRLRLSYCAVVWGMLCLPNSRRGTTTRLSSTAVSSPGEAMSNLIEPYRCRVTMSCDCRLG
jgi:hypothetical protein